ncbi:MAG: hypothetical protein RLZZ422_1485 [Pseudomonadota bacterium]|jgi:transcriptional regulator with XRE-family HTH domain
MQTGRRIDWATMLLNLRSKGLSLRRVARASGIPFTTLSGWQNLGREPLYSTGDEFINFYCGALKVGRDHLPRC